jgi:sn-glycerol 3-phosphate transport system substrate-binding protein
LGSFIAIRSIINAQLDAIWAGTVSAQQGLDEAVRQGNDLLKSFAHDSTVKR